MRAAIVGIAGPELATAEAALFRAHPPAGVILFGRNVRDPAQLRALTAALRAVLPAGAVLAVDQEGGRVARLRPPHWRAHPPAASIGAIWDRDSASARRAAFLTGALIGLDCAAAGLDLACAPVLDLHHAGAHDVIGDRAFSADPDAVAELASELAAGLLAAGVIPVGKHAPGHGRAQVDSHQDLPRLPAGIDMRADLRPFQRCAGLPWMMTAHLLYPDWDPARPATLSATVIRDVIRGQIGFAGVLVSDDLAMSALSGPPSGRALAALQAGCDLALFCPGTHDDNAALLGCCPEVPDDLGRRMALARDLVARSRQALDGATLDGAALAAERDALLASQADG